MEICKMRVDCYLHAGEHETVTHEVCRVAHSFAGLEAATKLPWHPSLSRYPRLASPVEVGLLLLDVDGVEWVEAEPGGKGEPGLMGPPATDTLFSIFDTSLSSSL